MASIDNLVNVSITQNTQAVALESFAIPLIIGKTNPGWSDRVHTYASPAGMLADGFTTTSPEYVAALSMFAGGVTPTSFMVGLRTSDTIANDLAAIVQENNSWYACMLAEPNDADIIAIAPVIEAMHKICISSTSTAATYMPGTSDFASVLGSQSLVRTGLMYRANPDGTAEAGWLGARLPLPPGSANWAYCTLPGVTPDVLTANQAAVLYGTPIAGIPGKNINVYQKIGGQPVTMMGQMLGGQYIDITIGLDWLRSSLLSNVFAQLKSATKIPYTDAGTAMLMLPVQATLMQGVSSGLLDGNDPSFPIKVTADPVSAVPVTQRAARIAPTIRFQARLQGAFNTVSIAGNISV